MSIKEVEIDCNVRAVTASAVQIDDGRQLVWIPRSQITDMTCPDEDIRKATSVFIPEWLAIEKGLV